MDLLSLSVASERASVPYARGEEVLLSATVQATDDVRAAVAHSRIVAVIDRSSSMHGQPIDLVKASLQFFVKHLKPHDALAIVTFGSSACEELPLTAMDEEGRRAAQGRIDAIRVSGCTALSAGLLRGLRMHAADRAAGECSRSVLLFTDGCANEGIVTTEKLVRHIAPFLNTSAGPVTVHTFGFGVSHEPKMLRAISDRASGLYYFIRDHDGIQHSFAECLGGVSSVVARDVCVSMRCAEGVRVVRVHDEEGAAAAADGSVTVRIGDVCAGERRTIPFTVALPTLKRAAPSEEVARAVLSFVAAGAAERCVVGGVWEMARPAHSDVAAEHAKPESIAVDAERHRVNVAAALREATALGERGRLEEARAVLRRAQREVREGRSHAHAFCQSLGLDIQQALECMADRGTFERVGSKYLYSLSRSLFQQRSSGVSSHAAAQYLTPAQRSLLEELRAPSRPGRDNVSSTRSPLRDSTGDGAPAPAPAKPAAGAGAVGASVQATAAAAVAVAEPTAAPAVDPKRLQRAVRRLMHDLREIHASPLADVVAAPLEDDMFEWHCGLRGPASSPFARSCFHIVMQVPHTYPFEPPKLFLCSYLQHDNVFGSYICLDLLGEREWSGEERATPYTGWSSAYSVQSVLLQLQSFLFDPSSVRDGAAVARAVEAAAAFECDRCGHSGKEPCAFYPPFVPAPGRAEDEDDAALLDSDAEIVIPPRVLRTVLPHSAPSLPARAGSKVSPAVDSHGDCGGGSTNAKAAAGGDVQRTQGEPRRPTSGAAAADSKALATGASVAAGTWASRLKAAASAPPRSVVRAPAPAPARAAGPCGAAIAATPAGRAPAPVAAAPAPARAPQRSSTGASGGEAGDGWQVVARWDRHSAKYRQKQRALKQQRKELKRRERERRRASEPSAPVKAETFAARQLREQKMLRDGADLSSVRVASSTVCVAPYVPAAPSPSRPAPARVDGRKPRPAVRAADVEHHRSPVKEQQRSTPAICTATQAASPAASGGCTLADFLPREQRVRTERVDGARRVSLRALLRGRGDGGSGCGLERSPFAFLPDDMITRVFSHVALADLTSLSLVCKQFLRLSCAPMLWGRQLFHHMPRGAGAERDAVRAWKAQLHQEKALLSAGLVCFHSKVSFRDAVLGIPITYRKKNRANVVQYIDSTLDLLSHEAFQEDRVRLAVWKQPFTHWMPLYLSPEHGERAWPLIERSLAQLCLRDGAAFVPSMALEVIPKLMNTMVVAVMSGDTHCSIAALDGYCAFHHLLLKMVQRYPILRQRVAATVGDFVRSERTRTKHAVASLGDFLPLLTVCSEYEWQDVRLAYLQENFDRNALWAIKKYPELAAVDGVGRRGRGRGHGGAPVSAHVRTRKTLEATKTSMRLLLFHVWFLTRVARPHGVGVDAVAANYDVFMGRPSQAMNETLQRECKRLLAISSWDDVFAGVGLPPLPTDELAGWLEQAVRNSKRKGYH